MAALEKSAFFEQMESAGLALTFDDVRLETRESDITPAEANISSRFSRRIELKTPMVSAAMDTVTTSNMAIAMAKLGGLGIVHAGLSPEDQAHEVKRVKLHLNGLIESPVEVKESMSIEEVLRMCEERQFGFSTFPVIDSEGKLVGLMTQNDFDFSDKQSSVASAMTPLSEVISAPASTSFDQAHELMLKNKKKTLPLVNMDGSVAGLYVFSDVSRIVGDNSGSYNVDESGRLLVGAAVPTDEEAVDRVRGMGRYLDVAVIDSSQGDSRFAFETLKRLKEEFPGLQVVVGNISNGRSAKRLADAGADGIKVGQGPGSICTTRAETGTGTPQVTAVYDCAKAVEGNDVPICADGGLTNAGDIPIALAAGADSVMMGRMLAGTKEAPGDFIDLEDGSRVMVYRGMGSLSAMKDSAAARKRYDAESSSRPMPEGVEAHVSYRGSVTDAVHNYIQGLRRAMSLAGAADIETLRKETKFIRITNAGFRESHPHDVHVIR